MTPLHVTAKLISPVAGAFDLPLDGILSAAWMRASRPDLYYSCQMPATVNDLVEAELPLLKRELDSDEWYWPASFALWPRATAEEMQTWNKRVDQKEIHRVEEINRLNIGAGRYKAYHMPVPTRSALELHWYAVGDAAEVESLLRMIAFVGKKRSQGMGQVREWRVEKTAEDFSVWKDGRPMRSIPFAGSAIQEGLDVGLRTYRPPYAFAQRQTVCILADSQSLIWKGGE